MKLNAPVDLRDPRGIRRCEFSTHKKELTMQTILPFARELGFPPEHIEALASAERAITAKGGEAVFTDAAEAFIEKRIPDTKEAAAHLEELGRSLGIHEYTVDALFVLYAFLVQRKDYVTAHGEEVFLASARDLLYKVNECIGAHGIVGTVSLHGWYRLFLRRELFSLGRLQFHVVSFPYPDVTVGGRTIKKGDPIIKTHIPSSGRLRGEDCLDAYRRAYRFFRHRFTEDTVPFFCASWLLDPEIAAAMPEGGIAQFASHFHIFDVTIDEADHDLWRVFGKTYESLADLPRKSRLQVHIADRLIAGGHMAEGFGAFFFDGENILK